MSEFNGIIASASELAMATEETDEQMKASFTKFSDAAIAQLSAWKAKDSEAQKRIDLKRKELEDQGIRLDMAYVQKLATDEATQKLAVANLKKWVPHLKDLRRSRATALKERWEGRERVATIRDAYARSASQTLKEALSDLLVSLKYVRHGYSPDAERHIIQAMGWKTVQQARAAILVEKLTIPKLLEAIERKDLGAITNLKTQEGVLIFGKAQASGIFERLGQPATKFALERCEIYDLPQLQVTKMVPIEGGKQRAITRGSQLSLGQQQSVLLALILSSNSCHPLIIDQPEDNLDSEFIYHSLVPVLRRAKERRQIIIVTHNANVAVLGDAELIVVLKSSSEFAKIIARGSIDHIETRDAACNILEGAKEAFLRRAKIYGVNVQ